MSFEAQANTNKKIQENINFLKSKFPNGATPHKEKLANLKGILPNPETMKNILECGAGVPSQFLGGFDPAAALLATVAIPKADIEIQDPIVDVVDRPISDATITEQSEGEPDYTGMSFSKAYNLARRVDVVEYFTWNGSRYHTKMKKKNGQTETDSEWKAALARNKKNKKPKIEEGIPFEEFNENVNLEGLTKKEIEKLKKEEERKKELNDFKSNAIKKLEEEAAEKINIAAKEIEELKKQSSNLENVLGSGISGATGAPGVQDMLTKIEAFKFFKAQIAAAEERIKLVQEEVEKDIEKVKEILESDTDAIDDDKNLKKENEEKESNAKSKENTADTFKSKPRSGGPEAGSRHDSKTTRKALENRLKADGFKKTLEQATENVKKFLEDNFSETKDILKALLDVLKGLLICISIASLLKTLLEVLMMLLFSKCNNPNLNTNQTPEEYLCDLGFPGFCDADFTLPEQPIERLPITSFSDTDIFDPQIIGTPLEQNDLNDLNKDFTNHPLLGDISNINPQIINELYNEGILPPPTQFNPDQFAPDLDKLYDQVVDDLVSSKNIEYIEHLYNLNFEKIGYKRYFAPEESL